MASFLDKLNDFQKSITNKAATTATGTIKDGFQLPANYSVDQNNLPYNQVRDGRDGTFTRNIMSFFVPQFGLVKLFINPANLQINDSKQIIKERTKGGYSLQYWGENLTDITLSGTTGSSGIEGINVLEQVYRAEQYAFDGTALLIDAANANNSYAKSVSNGLKSNVFGSILSAATGLDENNTLLAPANIPSLGQLAFSVEIYYAGIVYRGYFDSFTSTESADNFLINYSLKFTATQKRGYRTNVFPFQQSPKYGPSQVEASNKVYTFSGKVK